MALQTGRRLRDHGFCLVGASEAAVILFSRGRRDHQPPLIIIDFQRKHRNLNVSVRIDSAGRNTRCRRWNSPGLRRGAARPMASGARSSLHVCRVHFAWPRQPVERSPPLVLPFIIKRQHAARASHRRRAEAHRCLKGCGGCGLTGIFCRVYPDRGAMSEGIAGRSGASVAAARADPSSGGAWPQVGSEAGPAPSAWRAGPPISPTVGCAPDQPLMIGLQPCTLQCLRASATRFPPAAHWSSVLHRARHHCDDQGEEKARKTIGRIHGIKTNLPGPGPCRFAED